LESLQKSYNVFSSDIWEKINAMNFTEAIKDIGGDVKTEEDIIKLTTLQLEKTILNKKKEIIFINGQDIPELTKKQRTKTLNNQIYDLEDKKKGIVDRVSNVQIWGEMKNIMVPTDFEEFKEIVNDFYEEMETYDASIIKIDNILNKIKHPIDNMRERIITALKSGEKLCSICVQVYDNPIILKCNHVYCANCIFSWIKQKSSYYCPYCKAPIDPKDLNLVSVSGKKNKVCEHKDEDNEIDDSDENFIIQESSSATNNKFRSLKDKIDTIKNIMKNKPDGKFLIFSSYDGTFQTIGNMLQENEIKYKMLKGASSTIMNILNDFKNGKNNVLMLNSTHKGAGLEISSATDIIITHTMTSELEKQVIGRSQRPGRECQLNVHYIYYSNELN